MKCASTSASPVRCVGGGGGGGGTMSRFSCDVIGSRARLDGGPCFEEVDDDVRALPCATRGDAVGSKGLDSLQRNTRKQRCGQRTTVEAAARWHCAGLHMPRNQNFRVFSSLVFLFTVNQSIRRYNVGEIYKKANLKKPLLFLF